MTEDDDPLDRLARLRAAIEQSRLASEQARRALVDARQDLIEDFGDWMCGEGHLPDHADIHALDELAAAAEHAQRDYLRCMTELACMISAATLHGPAANRPFSARP